MGKSPAHKQQVLSQRAADMPFLRFFERLWRLQGALGGFIHGENPVGSDAWKHILVGPAYEANFHQCA